MITIMMMIPLDELKKNMHKKTMSVDGVNFFSNPLSQMMNIYDTQHTMNSH